MSSTRDFVSPGIFAEDATTTIPPTPIAGVAYRDAVAGTDDVPNGWRYGTRVDSKDWNQIMFLITSLAQMQDKQGILGWSDDVDYAVPAITFGSNGLLYIALQASGPSTTPRDPISEPTFWQQFNAHGRTVISATGTFNVPLAMQLGYIKPVVTAIGGGGGGGRFDNGGGGGGGGGIASAVVDLTGVTTVAVTIGAGGAGRTGSSGSGSSGGNTQFGAFLTATGGTGASLWAGGATGIGTIGSQLSGLGCGQHATRHDNTATTSKYGGGNGGGPGGIGSVAAATGSPGTAASLPGGGGGGGNENGNGAAGAAGQIVIEW